MGKWKDTVKENLKTGGPAIQRHHEISYLLNRCISSETNFLFLLENTMFDMATSELTDGILYAVAFKSGQRTFLRFFEYEEFSGFMESKEQFREHLTSIGLLACIIKKKSFKDKESKSFHQAYKLFDDEAF
ncbi:hypothetical protein DPMN_103072 [Dreissena polymorpha]|uniref:Uncharacterized protein n=1 Tax=Dreissena polymorpha TaxID=45954 RepID=A0A9D4H7T2_DREPO|nr:hypothetical protein DPMN_103072 [Dreissena polymorpha]